MALDRVGLNRPVRLARVEGGRGLQQRLASMGLRSGVVVEVISNTNGGPMVVAVSQTRIVLGRGMAHKIHVCEV